MINEIMLAVYVRISTYLQTLWMMTPVARQQSVVVEVRMSGNRFRSVKLRTMNVKLTVCVAVDVGVVMGAGLCGGVLVVCIIMRRNLKSLFILVYV